MKNYFEYFTGEASKIVSTVSASGKRRSTIVLFLAYLYFKAQTDLVDIYDAEAFDSATTDKSTKLTALLSTAMSSDSNDIRIGGYFRRNPPRGKVSASFDADMVREFNQHLTNNTLKDQFQSEIKLNISPVDTSAQSQAVVEETNFDRSEKFATKRDSLMTADLLYEYILRAKMDTLALGVGPNRIASERKAIIDKANSSNDPSVIKETGELLEAYYNKAKSALSNVFK